MGSIDEETYTVGDLFSYLKKVGIIRENVEDEEGDDTEQNSLSYYTEKRQACIDSYLCFLYSQYLRDAQTITNQDCLNIIERVHLETNITINQEDILAEEGVVSVQSLLSSLREILSNSISFDTNTWQSLDDFMEIDHKESDFLLDTVTLFYDPKENLSAVFGFVKSGSLSVGDTILLGGLDENNNGVRYSANVTWIEWNGQSNEITVSGEFVGIGIDVLTCELPNSIYYGMKEGEFIATLSNEDVEYSQELKDFLEYGEISTRERKLIDKLRVKLGISEQRADEIERHYKLTEAEQEYLDEYREIISKGEISSRDRHFLDKLKKLNDISEERSWALENMA